MPDRPLNATAASLLGFLHDGPMAGWDLVATAQAVIGDFWSLTPSQVYRELAAMADTGLVQAGERGRRDRRPYTITAAGRRAFATWLDREPSQETIRFPLLLTISFGRHLPPQRLATFVTQHRAVHTERLARYEQILGTAGDGDAALDPYLAAIVNYGIAYEHAMLTWFDQLSASVLRDPARAQSTPAS